MAHRNDSLNDGALCGGSFGSEISTVGFVPLRRGGGRGVGFWAQWPAPFYLDFPSINSRHHRYDVPGHDDM